ncbi:MAG: cupin domain-containing protein [Saprospiraceae bacterium]|nr:cupin domain-containing protein [Saprospiraceae bacterium]
MLTDPPILPPVPNDHGSALALADQLDFRPEKFNSKVLFREEGFNLILFALLNGQAIPAHKTPHNAYLQCLKGQATVTIADTAFPLQKGEIILLPKGILHGIVALKKTKLLLIKQS